MPVLIRFALAIFGSVKFMVDEEFSHVGKSMPFFLICWTKKLSNDFSFCRKVLKIAMARVLFAGSRISLFVDKCFCKKVTDLFRLLPWTNTTFVLRHGGVIFL